MLSECPFGIAFGSGFLPFPAVGEHLSTSPWSGVTSPRLSGLGVHGTCATGRRGCTRRLGVHVLFLGFAEGTVKRKCPKRGCTTGDHKHHPTSKYTLYVCALLSRWSLHPYSTPNDAQEVLMSHLHPFATPFRRVLP